jgi:hypothetical protein
MDAVSAFIGYRSAGDRVLLAENTQLTDAKSYRLTAWVRAADRDAFPTVAALKGARACFAGLESFSFLGTFKVLLDHAGDTGFDASSISSAPLADCDSAANTLMDAFFPRACAPPAHHTSGRTLACPDHPSAYAEHVGALRGLADGICDVAFARESSYIDACLGSTPRSWCDGLSLHALSNADDTIVSATEALGLSPGTMLMVRDGAVADDTLPALSAALAAMAVNATLAPYLSLARGLQAPINGQYATLAATQLALDPLAASIEALPGGPAALLPSASTPACAAFDYAEASSPAAADDAATVVAIDTRSRRTFHTPAPAPLSRRLRLAVPLPTPAHRQLWEAQLAGLRTHNLTVEVLGLRSASSLHAGEADIVWTDAFTAAQAYVRHGHQLLAVGASYAAVSRSTATAASGAVTETVSATVTTATSSGLFLLDPALTALAPADAAALAGLRLCAPSYAYAAAAAASMPALSAAMGFPALLADAAKQALTIDHCDAPALDAIATFFGPSCAPPLHAGAAGICDLCSLSAAPAPLSSAEPNRTAAAAVCGPGNANFGPLGSLYGLSARACDVAILPVDTYTRACDPLAHPLASSLAAAAATDATLPIPACVAPATPVQTLPSSPAHASSGFLIRAGALDTATRALLYEALTTDTAPALLAALGTHKLTHPYAHGAAATATYTVAADDAGTLVNRAYVDAVPAPSAAPGEPAYTAQHLSALVTALASAPGGTALATCGAAAAASMDTDAALPAGCSVQALEGCDPYRAAQTSYTGAGNGALRGAEVKGVMVVVLVLVLWLGV